MKRFLFVTTILFFSCDDIGKDYNWLQKNSTGFSRRFGTIGYDYGWNAALSPFDQGIIIVGQIAPTIDGESDLWAIKTDKNGLMEWERRFGGGQNESGYDVIATSDGGFLFVGYSWSFGNQQQVYAIKTDFHGNVTWEKTYGGSMWDVGNSVIEVVGGGYVIVGYSNSPGISSGNTDIYLLKINLNGDLVWEKSYGNNAYPNHEWGNDIIQISDQGFIIVGARDRYSEGSLNGLVLRIDKTGKVIWEKELIDNSQIEETIYSISQSNSGNFYLCSAINSTISAKKYQPKITKIDGSGNIDWQRTLNSDSRKYHQFRAITTASGNIVLIGSSSNELGSSSKQDAFMLKLDEKGNILWTHPYGAADHDDWGWSLFETAEKNIVFIGSTKSFGASLFDIYLVGTNSLGISK